MFLYSIKQILADECENIIRNKYFLKYMVEVIWDFLIYFVIRSPEGLQKGQSPTVGPELGSWLQEAVYS